MALLYQKDKFKPTFFKAYPLYLKDKQGKRDYTRDQLMVSGKLEGEPLHVVVNHWPSRSGGQKRSAWKRRKAAELCRQIVDKILDQELAAKIVVMGDFNDTPTDHSIRKHLKTTLQKQNKPTIKLFNPFEKLHKRGRGTNGYRDEWNLLDQLLFSSGWTLDQHRKSWSYWKVGIYNKPYIITQKGRYRGYPYRSMSGSRFIGGFSDHFPVYAYIVRAVD